MTPTSFEGWRLQTPCLNFGRPFVKSLVARASDSEISTSTRCSVSKKATHTDKLDRRHYNDPHRTVRALGAEAARKGLRVFDCPYSHPAMRASWLKGFAQEQQQQLDF
ncbi:CrpP family protein [Pseudomonas aeruginosa]|nr:CrpP family protein [Pseudomonas aeruginosa]MBI7330961.1 CrpP family protein [Pseudomonas aeruginosa]MBI7497290.1 CrpP family protein [Pseudomonas aeruginosa]NYU26590.1 CrpP family protein [Pseudomonas aeruginosa]HCF5488356.1 CrpP family protein [Pseudomonas aeruginosa]